MRKLAVGLVLCGVLVAWACSGGTPLPKDGSGDPYGAWVRTQYAIEDKLKSPSTVDYPAGVAVKNVRDLGGGRYEIKSHFDAQNSFGATVRTKFRCKLRKLNSEGAIGQWEIESLEFYE